MALPGPQATVSLASPSVRFHPSRLPAWVSALITAAADIQCSLIAIRLGQLNQRTKPSDPGIQCETGPG